MTGKGTVVGVVVALVQAIIGLALAFGLDISKAREQAIVDLVVAFAAVIPVVGAIFDHGKAQATARVAAAVVIATPPAVAPPGTDSQ